MSRRNSTRKNINFKVQLDDITDKITKKKENVHEVRSVTFSQKNMGLKVTIKSTKGVHPFKKWDKEMFSKDEDFLILLEVPRVRQRRITDRVPSQEPSLEDLEEEQEYDVEQESMDSLEEI